MQTTHWRAERALAIALVAAAALAACREEGAEGKAPPTAAGPADQTGARAPSLAGPRAPSPAPPPADQTGARAPSLAGPLAPSSEMRASSSEARAPSSGARAPSLAGPRAPSLAPPEAASPTPIPAERPARLAGSWYPADPTELTKELDTALAAAKEEPAELPARHLLGVIVPHAGYRFSARTAAAAYRLVGEAHPKRVFVMGPSHHSPIRGVVLVEARTFGTPLGPLTIDTAALDALSADPLFVRAPEVDAQEHSVEMQMPFIRKVAPDAKVVPLIVGRLTLDEVQRVASRIRALLGPGDLLVASSDFTHYGPNYGYVPFRDDVPAQLKALDMEAWANIESGDTAAFWRFKHRTGDTICGFYPVSILMEALGGKTPSRLMRYDTSGAVTGDTLNSVSYLAIALARDEGWADTEPPGGDTILTAEEQKLAVRIARQALETWFRTGEVLDARAAGLVAKGALERRQGVFVTLNNKADHSLRGCIGDVMGAYPLHEGIARHALDAALRDTRFEPVTAAELPGITIDVTVLTKPTPVAGTDAITIGRDGVILSKDGRSALFLPQVAVEQGWDLVTTLRHLAAKAGLGPDGWRGASFQTFQGQVYDELHLAPARAATPE